ncbi:MAG: hypothetical protein ACK4UJ_03870 [Leptonema sp. (in: bacteria)]
METRLAPELGLKNVNYYKPLNQQEPPVPKEANIPGQPLEGKLFRSQEKAQNAILPSQAMDTFRIKGTIVDYTT